MTTILADHNLRVMVSDSNMTDGDRAWSTRKVHRINGWLIGCSGIVAQFGPFLEWVRKDMRVPPEFDFDESTALFMEESGLYLFDVNTDGLTKVPGGIEAIGSGGMGAICAYEAMTKKDPRKAVRIACKHDAGSRGPVRAYRL